MEDDRYGKMALYLDGLQALADLRTKTNLCVWKEPDGTLGLIASDEQKQTAVQQQDAHIFAGVLRVRP